jgi:hypothetical protein
MITLASSSRPHTTYCHWLAHLNGIAWYKRPLALAKLLMLIQRSLPAVNR